MTFLSCRIAAVCSSACLALWVIGAVPAYGQSLPVEATEPVSLAQTNVEPTTPIQEAVGLQASDDDFDVPPVNDPFEPINRVTLEFNQQLDDWLIRPAAKGYDTVVPPPVRLIIGNVFGNVGDLWAATNNLLQGKPGDAGSDALRFAINTTFGLGGIADLASDFGLPKHKEDFGQTLGRWGLPEGPYLVLPLFGPGSVRDAVGTIAGDLQANPFRALPDPGARNAIMTTRLVDARARVLSGDRLFNEISIDRYLFVRDAYLQRRESQIWDGDPPPRLRKGSRR
jgi:phospholipid-binding lipoprotein MlaA